METSGSNVEMTGRLKWYSVKDGFGFLVVDDIGDVFIHSSMIKMDHVMWAVPAEGIKMKVLATKTPKGWRATKLIDPDVK